MKNSLIIDNKKNYLTTVFVLVFSTTCLAILALLTLLTPTLQTNAKSTESELNVNVDAVLEMIVQTCNDSNNSVVKIEITPSTNGTFKSNCQNVTVHTNNPGYSLSVYHRNGLPGVEIPGTTSGEICRLNLNSSNPPEFNCEDENSNLVCIMDITNYAGEATWPCNDPMSGKQVGEVQGVNSDPPFICIGVTLPTTVYSTELVYQNPTTLDPKPIIESTSNLISAPNTIANDTWGFAVEAQLLFDTTYTIDNASNNFAELPTDNTTIYKKVGLPSELQNDFTFYYAARLTPDTMAGTYATTITYTAIGESPAPLPMKFLQISSVSGHGCGILQDGKTYCWGKNDFGQLGNGSIDDSSIPVVVSGDYTFKQISVGGNNTCAITTNGKAYCWGWNTKGQLGISYDDNEVSHVPIAVASDYTFSQIAVGENFVCAISIDGNTYCWGSGEYGQLGNNSNDDSIIPVAVADNHNFSQISAGSDHTCGVTTDKVAYCWGGNFSGQLGDGSWDASAKPVAIANHNFNQISAGSRTTCAITTNGDAYCWGFGEYGQLGNENNNTSNSLVAVVGDYNFAQISVGGDNVCAITTNKEAYCWGRNNDSQLGNSIMLSSNIPVSVVEGYKIETGIHSSLVSLTNTSSLQISSGSSNACIISGAKIVYCWGAIGFLT